MARFVQAAKINSINDIIATDKLHDNVRVLGHSKCFTCFSSNVYKTITKQISST